MSLGTDWMMRKMKKIFSVALALVLMMAMFVSSASAATKADLINAIKDDPILGHYDHVVNAVVNQMDNFDFTAEECDYLLDKFEEAKAIMASEGDKGETAHLYSDEAMEAMAKLVAEVVDELGYTHTYVPSQNPLHAGDIVLRVFDENGVVVFEYDGDYVKHTSEVVDTGVGNIGAYAALGGGVAILAIAVFFAVKGKKNVNEIEA